MLHYNVIISEKNRKFLFRCNDCRKIFSVEFSDEDDIEKINNNSVIIECECGGDCIVIRN